MKIIILIILLLLPLEARASVLSDTAATCAVGTWCSITISGLGTALATEGGASGTMTFFAMSGVWDTTSQKGFFMGADHWTSGAHGIIPTTFDAGANTWTKGSDLTSGGFIHGYDDTALDTATGTLYHLRSGTNSYLVANIANISPGGWTGFGDYPDGFIAQGISSTFVPSLGWVIYNSYHPGGQLTYRNTSGAWVDLANFSNGISTYHSGALYLNKYNYIIAGGGNAAGTQVYRYDVRTGATATLSSLPFNWGVDVKYNAAEDPVTGNVIFVGAGNTYELDPRGSGTLTLQTGTRVPPALIDPVANTGGNQARGVFSMPIPDHGVILYVSCATGGAGSCVSYLYKHAASSAADLDFAKRRNSRGAIRSWDFDSTQDLGQANGVGALYGEFNNNGSCGASGVLLCPQIDTSTKASGGGALKFTIPSQSGSGASGQWYGNFSDDRLKRYGSGQTFYVQWRQRFSCDFLYTNCPAGTGIRVYAVGGGWKLADLAAGDRTGSCTTQALNAGECNNTGGVAVNFSCIPADLIMQNTFQRGFLQAYHGCPGTYPVLGSFAFEQTVGADIRFQNAYTPNYCPYSEVTTGNTSHCFMFAMNEWMTIKERITLGTFTAPNTGACANFPNGCYPNSLIEIWIGRDGQPLVKIHSYTLAMNASRDGSEIDKWGKFWLLPYHTNKDASEVHPTAATWYDELIISTLDIADPGAVVLADAIPPTIQITGPTTNPTYATSGQPSTTNISLAGTAADETSLSSVTWVNNRGGSGTATGTTSWSIPAVTLQAGVNVITVTAIDGGGNTAVDTLTATYRVLAPVSFKIQ